MKFLGINNTLKRKLWSSMKRFLKILTQKRHSALGIQQIKKTSYNGKKWGESKVLALLTQWEGKNQYYCWLSGIITPLIWLAAWPWHHYTNYVMLQSQKECVCSRVMPIYFFPNPSLVYQGNSVEENRQTSFPPAPTNPISESLHQF